MADVFNHHKNHLNKICSNSWKSRTLHAVRKCRTSELGLHIDECTNKKCKAIHLSYNSCRNRHCPTCQGHKREEWIASRNSELLNVPYFHVVFTIPHELNEFALQHPKLIYAALFKASWETIAQFSENPKHLGARMGMIALLHTWGQNLQLHPHLHCIVPGGGVKKNGRWKKSRNRGEFLFNVESMSLVFRAKFVSFLRKNKATISPSVYDQIFKKNWVVYAKKPFRNPSTVIEYLGRYSHKVAISNYRILNVDNAKDTVTFHLKNYKKDGKKEVLTLSQKDFIRRFSLHVLPKGFTRIRHYGILSGKWKSKHLKPLQKQLNKTGQKQIEIKVIQHLICSKCKVGKLEPLFRYSKTRPPPIALLKKLNIYNTLIINA